MASQALAPAPQGAQTLKTYYFVRALVSIVWVVAAFTLGAANPIIGGVLLVLYPAWDALANGRDAAANGGLRANPTQALNLAVSVIVALGVAALLPISMNLVLAVFGAWAVLSGVLQLATGVRRWKSFGAQWAMILSGAQSTLAGVFFVKMSSAELMGPVVAIVAPYAAFGAFYFLISALALTIKEMRARRR